MHVFLVSENLEFFAHVHPVRLRDGSFRISIRLPYGGMYRLLADYYPLGSVPQLAAKTIFVSGISLQTTLVASLSPSESENLTASLRVDPAQPVAGLETRLFFTLEPAAGLERYLGAWAHLLAVSDDLIDLVHLHPFLADGGPLMQFNIIFPRPRYYRIWTQFQRRGVVSVVNTCRSTELNLSRIRALLAAEATTVSGLTRTRTWLHAGQSRRSRIQNIRSWIRGRARGCFRLSTPSCCRRARISRPRL